jgi:hypothetical protein
MGLWPLAEMAGGAAGARWLAAAGYGLLVVAFGACAAALVRSGPIGALPAPTPPLTTAAPSGKFSRG